MILQSSAFDVTPSDYNHVHCSQKTECLNCLWLPNTILEFSRFSFATFWGRIFWISWCFFLLSRNTHEVHTVSLTFFHSRLFSFWSKRHCAVNAVSCLTEKVLETLCQSISYHFPGNILLIKKIFHISRLYSLIFWHNSEGFSLLLYIKTVAFRLASFLRNLEYIMKRIFGGKYFSYWRL